MTDCASIEVGTLIGNGEAGSLGKAIKKAGRALDKEMRKVCVPGSCGQVGGKCTFKLQESSVSVDVRVVGSGTDLEYWVKMTGTGKCTCS